MFTDDIKWFADKNHRLILELLAILKHIEKKEAQNSDILNKIKFLKTRPLSHLSFAFLAPEGREWIYYTYNLLKSNSKENQTLNNFVLWLGINIDHLYSYLISKIDFFVFAVSITAEEFETNLNTLNVKAPAVLNVLDGAYVIDENFEIDLKVGDRITHSLNKNSISIELRRGSKIIFTRFFDKLPGSRRLNFYIDLVSQPSQNISLGRERLPRIISAPKLIRDQIKVIDKALRYIDFFDPSISNYFKSTPNYFVPLIPPRGSLPSSSNSSLDTMFWYSQNNEPLLTAEMIIHELSHQRLFRYQDVDPLLDFAIHGNGWDDCCVYSPWRDDPRPVNGVFHGYVVFSQAALFWLSLLSTDKLTEKQRNISKRRMAMLVHQLKFAQGSLNRCSFTPLGKKLFEQLSDKLHNTLFPYLKKHSIDLLPPYFMEYHDEETPSGNSILQVVNNHYDNWKLRYG